MVFGYRRRRFTNVSVRRPNFKRGLLTTNHCETTTVTAAGVELQTAMFTCVNNPTERQTNIPEGADLVKVRIRSWATDPTPVNGKHQCFLVKRPGAQVYTTGPIANWYSTTDPLTEEARDVRINRLSKKPHTVVTITGISGPPRYTCFWKGHWPMRDGDDVILSQLDAGITNWTHECEAWYVM